MKKFIFFALAIIAVNTACGSSTNHNDNTKTEKNMETTENGKVIHLNKADFLTKVYNYEKNPNEWKYEGDKPAIVDFYATWCGPCKMIAPLLEEMAKEYDGQIVIYKVDTDKEPELSAAFGIRSIPTLLFIPAEGEPQIGQGAMPKATLKKAIDEFLLGKK